MIRLKLILTILFLSYQTSFTQVHWSADHEYVFNLIDKISQLERQLSLNHSSGQEKLLNQKLKELEGLYTNEKKKNEELIAQKKQLTLRLEQANVRLDSLEKRNAELTESIELQAAFFAECMRRATKKIRLLLEQNKALNEELKKRQMEAIKDGCKVYLDGLNPRMEKGRLKSPKEISAELFYYPLPDEETPSTFNATIKLMDKNRTNSDPTWTITMRRRTSTKDGEKFIKYENNPTTKYSLEHKLEPGSYFYELEIKGNIIKSGYFLIK